MTYSGIIKDEHAGLSPRGPYPIRVIAFSLVAAALGWVFTVYMPQLGDMSLRIAFGLGIALALVFLTTNVSFVRGERMFAALFFAAAFVAGMWGLWVMAQFGAIPTLDQFRASASGVSYDLRLFGEPIAIRTYIFEIWCGMTALMASIPLLASLLRPHVVGAHSNPFDVHPDFAQPFGMQLLLKTGISFGIAGGAVYLFPYLAKYDIPLEVAVVPPLVAAFFYAKLHMNFPRAVMISIIGGIGGAAGFWLPKIYMNQGPDAVMAFVTGTPQDILARAQGLTSGVSYQSEIGAVAINYTPWVFEIWAGLTLAFLCLPLLVTLARRFMPLLRIG